MTYNEKQESVLNALRQAGDYATIEQILEHTSLERTDVWETLHLAEINGKVKSLHKVYRLTD